MKRSEINKAIDSALAILRENNIHLPAFAHWSPAQWKENAPRTANIREIGLGWDVTDFGTGDFARVGSVLFTLRNGSAAKPSAGTPYAEKLILQRHASRQEIPFHFHRCKTEDIINRGGGVLMLELYNSLADDTLDKSGEIHLRMDGLPQTLPAGAAVEIAPGGSITLTPGLFHRFWAKQGAGDLICGEVSSVNDDRTDNVFLAVGKRFSHIEEDESPRYVLCNEYKDI